MAATAIHYHPRLQAYVAVLYVAGLSFVAFAGEALTPAERSQDLSELSGLFSSQTNLIRIAMVVSAALILVLVARQGRLMLERAVREMLDLMRNPG